MSVFIVLMLFATGFLSGVVNAIAGGGTFLTFGAMTLAGLPPIVANATSAIVQFPGYITSVIAYGPEIRAHWREAILLSAVSVVGGLGGFAAAIARQSILPPTGAMAASGGYCRFRCWPVAAPQDECRAFARQSTKPRLSGACIHLWWFLRCRHGHHDARHPRNNLGGSYHHLNALKNLLSVVIAVIAIAIFVSGGVVSWWAALIMFPAAALGGYVGVHTARRVPQWIIRWLVIAVGLILTAYYFVSA